MKGKVPLGLLLIVAWRLAAAGPADAPAASTAVQVTAAAEDAFPARRLPVAAERRYTMHAGIRPLYIFWIRRDNVGSGLITWHRGAKGERGYQLIIGSDPLRAPRKINKWGYFSEEITPRGTSQLGIMNAFDKETIKEVEQDIEREGKEGAFKFQAIRTAIAGGSGRTSVFRLKLARDFTYREVEDVLSSIPSGVSAEREYQVAAGVRGGYLATIAEIIEASVKWHLTKGAMPTIEGQSLRYVYNGRPYVIKLRSSKFVPQARYKKATFTNVVEGQFLITNLTTGHNTDFRVDYGTQGDLAEVPVRIVFQPRWWLEAELVLNQETGE